MLSSIVILNLVSKLQFWYRDNTIAYCIELYSTVLCSIVLKKKKKTKKKVFDLFGNFLKHNTTKYGYSTMPLKSLRMTQSYMYFHCGPHENTKYTQD